jgi:hypothetical protein
MTAREQLIAYLCTLLTLVVVFVAALVATSLRPELLGKAEVFGLGTITGGLIGILRIPSIRSTASTETGDVVVKPPAEDVK